MNIRFSEKHKLEMVVLNPGDHHATREKRIIATLLGSCISVVLFDLNLGICGANHFMLSDHGRAEGDIMNSSSGRYGMYAMELLIGDIVKLGGDRRKLKAKVFGGGSVLAEVNSSIINVPKKNIQFALDYLAAEKIPIVSQDVGGTEGRKIMVFTETAKVLMKRIPRTAVGEIQSHDKTYLEKVRREEKKKLEGDLTLF